MKGLSGGIPIAVLAAVARAQVIGGSAGVDVGNAASIPNTNSATNTVDESQKDNHAVGINSNTVIGHGGRPHHYRDYPDGTRVRQGVSVGSATEVPEVHTYSHVDDDAYRGDHSIDVNEVHDFKYPGEHHHEPGYWGHHYRRHEEDPTVIGGPGGVDVGNAAAIPLTNKFDNSVSEALKDDHSADISEDTTILKPIVRPHRPEHGHPEPHGDPFGLDDPFLPDVPFLKRHESEDRFPEIPPQPTVIGGPGGVDVGNAADIPTTNTDKNTVDESKKDDHSVGINENTEIAGHPAHWGHHWRRSGPSVIGGPGGVDVGNAASIPTDNTDTNTVKESAADDHSVDVDDNTAIWAPEIYEHGWGHPGPGYHRNMHEARATEDPTVIGGPAGNDVGSAADIPTTNTASSTVDESKKDDHSFTGESSWTFGGRHLRRALRQGDTDVIGGSGGVDVGNVADIPTDNNYSSDTNESEEDDHSVQVDSNENIVAPQVHRPEPEKDDHSAHIDSNENIVPQVHRPEPACGQPCHPHTVVHTQTVVHTAPPVRVTKTVVHTAPPVTHTQTVVHTAPPVTRTEVVVHTAPPVTRTETVVHTAPPVVHTQTVVQTVPVTHTRTLTETVVHTVRPQHDDHSGPAELNFINGNDVIHGSKAAASSAMTPMYHAANVEATSTPVVAYHAAASSYAKIPVYVPESNAYHGTAMVAGSAGSAASAVATPSPALPSGADAQHGPMESQASQSASGPIFTGAGVRVTPSAGVFSVFAGVVGFLAFFL